eukprot:Colp12_sorted_trinity150504_noHs@5596
MARKSALGVSFVGELRYCQIEKSAVKMSAKYREPTAYKLKFDASVPSHKGAVVVEKGASKKVTKGVKSSVRTVTPVAKSSNAEVDTVFLSAQLAALEIGDGDGGGGVVGPASASGSSSGKLYAIPANNLLARLRRQGFEELVHVCIAFI